MATPIPLNFMSGHAPAAQYIITAASFRDERLTSDELFVLF